jgi:hypothetical protein
MTASNIGGGLKLRVCDLCGGVDDHPRHVLVGDVADSFPAPSDEIIGRVSELAGDVDRGRLLRDLMDTTSSDRHLDCCAAAGCPDGTCDRQVEGAGSKTGKAMVAHLMSVDDRFADRDDTVQALTAAMVDAARSGSPLKTVRAMTALLLGLAMLAARGLSAVNLANAWLNVISGTTFTGAVGSFIQLHTADPGASGTTAVSSVTTRPSATWNAASAGAKTISNTPSWTSWAGTSPETVTDISDWSASSAGTFYFSVALTANKTVQTGDTLTLNTLSVSLAPLAA